MHKYSTNKFTNTHKFHKYSTKYFTNKFTNIPQINSQISQINSQIFYKLNTIFSSGVAQLSSLLHIRRERLLVQISMRFKHMVSFHQSLNELTGIKAERTN